MLALPLVLGLLGICWDYHGSDLLASTMADCADYPDDPPCNQSTDQNVSRLRMAMNDKVRKTHNHPDRCCKAAG